MRTISITIVALVAFLFPMVASAQVIEESISRIKDRPPCLGFFVPDGGKPIPGVLVKREYGYAFMFTDAQAPGITEGAMGYFCLVPLLYYGEISGVEEEQRLKYVPVDEESLNITDARLAVFANLADTKLSSMYAVVPESARLMEDGNLKLNYRLFPVKKEGSAYRIINFLYTKDVPQGTYLLFGRTAEDNTIVFLGNLRVGEHNMGTVSAAFSET